MIPYPVIAGIFAGSATIADNCLKNSILNAEPGIRSPESAQGKSGCLQLVRSALVNWRHFKLLNFQHMVLHGSLAIGVKPGGRQKYEYKV